MDKVKAYLRRVTLMSTPRLSDEFGHAAMCLDEFFLALTEAAGGCEKQLTEEKQ